MQSKLVFFFFFFEVSRTDYKVENVAGQLEIQTTERKTDTDRDTDREDKFIAGILIIKLKSR